MSLLTSLVRRFLTSPRCCCHLQHKPQSLLNPAVPQNTASFPVWTASSWTGSTQALAAFSLSHNQNCSHFRRSLRERWLLFSLGVHVYSWGDTKQCHKSMFIEITFLVYTLCELFLRFQMGIRGTDWAEGRNEWQATLDQKSPKPQLRLCHQAAGLFP